MPANSKKGNKTMNTVIQYKGRVWTCDEHNAIITDLLKAGSDAKSVIASVHPKKGNKCKECARLYDETPPSSR